MILGYADTRTARFARGERVKAFEPFRKRAEMVLDRLDMAASIGDIANFPGHRLEKLVGDRKGQWSVRINGASALSGKAAQPDRATWKSWTIIEA